MKTKNKSKDDTFYTVKQIAEQTGLNQATLYGLLKYEHIISETVLGKRVVRKEVFEEWKEKNIKPKEKEESKKENKEVKKEKVGEKGKK